MPADKKAQWIATLVQGYQNQNKRTPCFKDTSRIFEEALHKCANFFTADTQDTIKLTRELHALTDLTIRRPTLAATFSLLHLAFFDEDVLKLLITELNFIDIVDKTLSRFSEKFSAIDNANVKKYAAIIAYMAAKLLPDFSLLLKSQNQHPARALVLLLNPAAEKGTLITTTTLCTIQQVLDAPNGANIRPMLEKAGVIKTLLHQLADSQHQLPKLLTHEITATFSALTRHNPHEEAALFLRVLAIQNPDCQMPSQTIIKELQRMASTKNGRRIIRKQDGIRILSEFLNRAKPKTEQAQYLLKTITLQTSEPCFLQTRFFNAALSKNELDYARGSGLIPSK